MREAPDITARLLADLTSMLAEEGVENPEDEAADILAFAREQGRKLRERRECRS